ncbi:MAG: cation transporter [DPANN group archaeon]|nr:cation transporter [DPANN group archaeon]
MDTEALRKNLRVVIILDASLFLSEIITAVFTNSTAILAAGVHVYANIFAMMLAWTAFTISRGEEPDRLTLCLRKKDVVLMAFNTLILLLLSLMLIFQATKGMIYPSHVDAGTVVIISLFALIINWFLLGLFRTHRHRDLKKISSHLTGNLVSSFIVFISAILTLASNDPLFDVIGAFLVSIILMAVALRIGRSTVVMLLHSGMAGIDLDQIRKIIHKNKQVVYVEKLEAWRVYDDEVVLNTTIRIRKNRRRQISRIIRDLRAQMKRRNIGYVGIKIVY